MRAATAVTESQDLREFRRGAPQPESANPSAAFVQNSPAAPGPRPATAVTPQTPAKAPVKGQYSGPAQDYLGKLQPGMNEIKAPGATLYATRGADGTPIFGSAPAMATEAGLDRIPATGKNGSAGAAEFEAATQAKRDLRNAQRAAEGSPPVGQRATGPAFGIGNEHAETWNASFNQPALAKLSPGRAAEFALGRERLGIERAQAGSQAAYQQGTLANAQTQTAVDAQKAQDAAEHQRNIVAITETPEERKAKIEAEQAGNQAKLGREMYRDAREANAKFADAISKGLEDLGKGDGLNPKSGLDSSQRGWGLTGAQMATQYAKTHGLQIPDQNTLIAHTASAARMVLTDAQADAKVQETGVDPASPEGQKAKAAMMADSRKKAHDELQRLMYGG